MSAAFGQPDLRGPRVHLRRTESTNSVARDLAMRGAVSGTLVTAAAQTAGRGRQGRSWSAPPGSSLLCSWVIRNPHPLLSLAAGAAVAQVAGHGALLKWPNDVLIDGRKVAGILVEGRPQEAWAVLGIGINVAVRLADLPEELRDRAGTLGLSPGDIEPVLARLRRELERWLQAPSPDVVEAVRAIDALRGAAVRWDGGHGRAVGIDETGRLLVAPAEGSVIALDAGEIHLERD